MAGNLVRDYVMYRVEKRIRERNRELEEKANIAHNLKVDAWRLTSRAVRAYAADILRERHDLTTEDDRWFVRIEDSGEHQRQGVVPVPVAGGIAHMPVPVTLSSTLEGSPWGTLHYGHNAEADVGLISVLDPQTDNAPVED